MARTQGIDLSMTTLRVFQIDPLDPRWEAFVSAHPDSLIFHHPAWLQALTQEYDRKGMHLACEDAQGRLRGILPLIETRGLPLNWAATSTGPRLSSLPRTPVAGPLALDNRATEALLRSAIELIRDRPSQHLQLKTRIEGLEELVEGLVVIPWRLSYVLELPKEPEVIRFGNSRNHAGVMRAVSKALRSGVEVRRAESKSDVHTWYQLYLEAMRRIAVPPRPYRFFDTLWEQLQPRGLMRLLLAEHREGQKRTLLAGVIVLTYGKTVSYAYSGSRQQVFSLRPNDILHWQAIHDACQEGYRWYDLGEVPEDHQGLARFKSKWGAEPQRIFRYYYPTSPVSARREYGPDGHFGQLARTAWRRMPVCATAWLGDLIYSFL